MSRRHGGSSAHQLIRRVLKLRLRLHHRYFAGIMLLVTSAMAAVAVALILQYETSMAEARDASSHSFAVALNGQFENRATGLALVTADALVNSWRYSMSKRLVTPSRR